LKVCGGVLIALLCAAAVNWVVAVEKGLRRDACAVAHAVLTTAEAPDVPKSAKYAKCRHVFIDGGTNRGDTVEAFAGDTPNNEISEAREVYLKRIKKTVRDVCYFGFEASKKFNSKLREVQAKYAGRFAHIELFGETVLLSKPENVSYWAGEIITHQVIVDPRYKEGMSDGVARGVDLAAFIAQFSLDSLYLKLDIESSEYAVMRRLLATGQLCQPKRPTHLSIEFHPPKAPSELVGDGFLEVVRCCGVVTNVFY